MKNILNSLNFKSVSKKKLYHHIIYIVFIYVNIYALIYYFLGAKLTAFSQLFLVWISTPILFYFEKIRFPKVSRFIFIISCLLYIIIPEVEIRADIKLEYYFLAALLIPMFLFAHDEKKSILVGQLLCVFAWGVLKFLPHPEFPSFLMPAHFPVDNFQNFNFVGALVIIVIITKFFVSRYESLLLILKNIADRQENILQGSALGSWDWWIDENKIAYDSRWCEMIGLQANEIKHDLSIWDTRVHPEDKSRTKQEMEDYLEGKTNRFENIHRLRHENGAWVWILACGRIAKRDSAGRPIHFLGTHYNITFYKEAEHIQKNIQRIAQIGWWELTIDSNELIWSDEVYRIYGLLNRISPMEIDWLKYYSTNDRLRLNECIKQCGHGIPYSETFNFTDDSGNIKWVQAMGQPVYDSNGYIYKLQGTLQDISSIKEKEIEIKQIFQALDECAIVAITDREGKIISANNNLCRLSGYSKDELIGSDHRLINSGEHPKAFFKNMWDTILSGKNWSGEVKNRAKNGEFYCVQTVITPLLDVKGNIQRFLAIRFDVTNEKVTQQLLEEAQAIAKIGSWSYLLKSGEIRWSRELYNLYPEDPQNGPPSFERLYSTIHPEDQKHWLEAIQNCINNAIPYRVRCRSVFPDGSFIWQEAFGKPQLSKDGTVISISGTAQDISELIKAEEATKVERAKAMHNAKLASLGEMSAGMAHEINNPLSIISATTWTIPKLINEPEKLKIKLENIEKATDRISKIVNGLRKFSRSSDKIVYKIHSLDFLIKESLVITSAKCLRFSTSIEYESKIVGNILCDEMEIEQILVNLINNGVDANKDSLEKWIKIELDEKNEHFIIRITDSGKGIPLSIQRKLFEPFFTTKAVGEGTGLGLSIVKGIIDEHNGSIEILNDSPNTCFELKFKKSDV